MEGGKGVRIGSTERRGGFLATDSVFPCLFVFFPSLSLLQSSIVRNHRFFFSLFFLTLPVSLSMVHIYSVWLYKHILHILIFNFWFSIPFFVSDYASFSFDTYFSTPPFTPPPPLSHHPNRDFLVLKNETRTQ